jgi:hypothetical protein
LNSLERVVFQQAPKVLISGNRLKRHEMNQVPGQDARGSKELHIKILVASEKDFVVREYSPFK